MSRSTRKSCCVIGASLHGLAAAGALQDQFDIEILEKNSDIGALHCNRQRTRRVDV